MEDTPKASNEFNTILETQDIFVDDGLYKPLEQFKETIPDLPEFVYHTLYLRYNRNILTEEEVKAQELILSRFKENTRRENQMLEKAFLDNSANVIVCEEEPI